MSAVISQASFWHFDLNGPHFRSTNIDSDSGADHHERQYRAQSPLVGDRRDSDRGPSDGNGSTAPAGAKMDIPAAANSSTVEEPPPGSVIDAAGDASDRATDIVHSPSRPRSASALSSSSGSSESGSDRFDARNRRFPPLLPSTNRPHRPLAIPRFAAAFANVSSRGASADLSAADSSSVTNSWSSEGGEEDSDAEDHDDEDNETDDGGEDDDDRSDWEDDEDSRVQALWGRLRDQRDAVRQLRLALSDKRKHLRELRRRKDDADNRYMGMVRPYLVAGHGLPSPGDVIIRLFEAMQRESNEYHDEEAEVERLEAKLEEEELARETLETQFFTILYRASGGSGRRESLSSDSETDSYAPPSRASLLGIPADRPTDIHPLYKQLLDAVGDRELAKEHHAELTVHRDSILYDLQLAIKRERLRDVDGRADKKSALPDTSDMELLTTIAENPARLQELKAKYRDSIGEENEEFLREFPQEEAMLREKVKEAKDAVDKLRRLCIDKGVMRKNAPYHEEYTIFSDTGEPFSAETMSISRGQLPKREEGLANTRFPILLSNPRHVLEDEFPLTARGALRAATRLPNDHPARPQLVAEALKEYGISTLVTDSAADNKSDYINRWLLHRLRISPLEVELLYTIFSTHLKVKNTRRWQEDVLFYWSRDEANKPKEEYDGIISTPSLLSIDDDDDDEDEDDDDLGSEDVESAPGQVDHPGTDPGDMDSPLQSQEIRPPQSLS